MPGAFPISFLVSFSLSEDEPFQKMKENYGIYKVSLEIRESRLEIVFQWDFFYKEGDTCHGRSSESRFKIIDTLTQKTGNTLIFFV